MRPITVMEPFHSLFYAPLYVALGLGHFRAEGLDVADRGGGVLPHFIEVNSRNGFFLLGREPRPAFRWSELAGKTVLSFAEAPRPGSACSRSCAARASTRRVCGSSGTGHWRRRWRPGAPGTAIFFCAI